MKYIYTLLTSLLLLVFFTASAQINKNWYYHMGQNYILDNKYEDGINTLNTIIRVDPDAYEAYFLRGIAKYNLEDLIGAEWDFSTAIEKNPVYTLAYQYRAITRARLGNYDDALKDFQEAIDLRPDRAGAYYSRGVTFYLSQQFDKAVEDFSRFIRLENKVVDAYINRGASYLQMNDTIRAMEDFENAIRTNREDPAGYNRRGTLYMAQRDYGKALADFNKAVECDSSHMYSFFNRAIVYADMEEPVLSIKDFDKVIELDTVNSLAYFNRAIIKSQIGDYMGALNDYSMVSVLSPDNVLVYYNRAGIFSQLGNYNEAIRDYTRAIELYPDFANAYLNRSALKYRMSDMEGSRNDKLIADRKINEYRSKLNDSTFSIYADTSSNFNRLLSFDTRMGGSSLDRTGKDFALSLLPMFSFKVMNDQTGNYVYEAYRVDKLTQFRNELDNPNIRFTTKNSDYPADSLVLLDARLTDELKSDPHNWKLLFEKAIVQGLIKQYTSSVNTYTDAIERNPSNPFLYINRSTTRSEMIDFISSIDNSYQNITVDNDPINRLKSGSSRQYSYDEAIADLNKAAKLLPELAHIYYNRGNLEALSGRFPESYDEYSQAIRLHPEFGEAYFNRGLIQIYMKDTQKGLLDISKAGELGITEAYEILKHYTADN